MTALMGPLKTMAFLNNKMGCLSSGMSAFSQKEAFTVRVNKYFSYFRYLYHFTAIILIFALGLYKVCVWEKLKPPLFFVIQIKDLSFYLRSKNFN